MWLPAQDSGHPFSLNVIGPTGTEDAFGGELDTQVAQRCRVQHVRIEQDDAPPARYG